MKKFILSAVLSAFAVVTFAQNSAIYKIEELMDAKKLDEAAKLCQEALANPKTTKFQELYKMAADIQTQIFQPTYFSAARGIEMDTTLFVTSLENAIDFYTKSHVAAMTPNDKGKVKYDKAIEKDCNDKVKTLYDFIYYAAVFENQRGDVPRSVHFFQKYIDMADCPVFTEAQKDSIKTHKAEEFTKIRFNIALLNYNLKNWEQVLTATETALKDTFQLNDLYIMRLNANLGMNDTTAWLQTLSEGAQRLNNSNMAQQLVQYYMQKRDAETAMKLADEMIAKNPDADMPYYIKGCIEQNIKEDNKTAIEWFTKAIEKNPNFADAIINRAVCKINDTNKRLQNGEFPLVSRGTYTYKKSVKNNNNDKYKKEADVLLGLYKDAESDLEKAKGLIPNEARKWAFLLELVYTNLGRLYGNVDEKEQADKYAELKKQMEALEDELNQR